MQGDGRVVRQSGGRGWVAHVRITYVPESTSGVSLAPSLADSWRASAEWLEAARVGAALGLKLANAAGSCTITHVHDPHDVPRTPHPRLVAIAAIRAVWNAVSFAPPETVALRLEQCIDRGGAAPGGLEAELCG